MEPRLKLTDFNDLPTSNPANKPRHTWTPQNIITLAKNPPEPPTIGGILYPGKRTLISGETEALKTWLALIFAKAEIQAGFHVAWVDLDDMGPNALLQRLRALELADEQIADMFLYYQPEERLAEDRLTDALLQLTITGARMMVIDAFTPMLALHGLDPNNAIDIENFWRDVCDPIAKLGVAPVVLDHVTKNPDSRGKYSTGSERKASGATVHIGAKLLEALAIGGTGRSILEVHKDRPGYLPRPTLGRLVLTSDGTSVSYELEEDRSHAGGGFRPTVLMERVSRTLEVLAEPVTGNWVEQNVKGNKETLRTCLQALTNEGFLTFSTGPRNSHLYASSKPYREDEDETETTAPLTAPDRPQISGLFGLSTTAPTAPLPTGAGAVGGAPTGRRGQSQNGTAPNVQNGHLEAVPFELIFDTEPDPQEDT